MTRPLVISINSSWNVVNFRAGLLRGLQHNGYDVVAVAPQDDFSSKLIQMGCGFIPIEIDNQGTNPLRDTFLFARYRKILQDLRPIAFLGYTIKPNIYGSLAAHSLGIPVINNISGLGTAFIRRTWLTLLARSLYRTSLRHSHSVFFQNEDDRELFVSLGLVHRSQTAVLPGSGIDLLKFSPTRSNSVHSRTAKKFLLIARLLWDKGIAEYVDAARIVKTKHPEAKFCLLGFLDVKNRTAVSRSDVDAWVNAGLIEYLGETDDVRPFIAESDCIVLPSYREGTPRTLLEAAAMGKPLIATDVPGCRNVVEHGRNGFLCRPQDAESLAEVMLHFMSLPAAEIVAFGERSRAKIEEQFDERLVIDRYIAALAAIERRNVVPARS